MRPLLALLSLATFLPAAEIKPVKWSGAINVPDPVAVTVDEAGAVYATSTTRRKVADLDIRELPTDLVDWRTNAVGHLPERPEILATIPRSKGRGMFFCGRLYKLHLRPARRPERRAVSPV